MAGLAHTVFRQAERSPWHLPSHRAGLCSLAHILEICLSLGIAPVDSCEVSGERNREAGSAPATTWFVTTANLARACRLLE